MRSVLVKKVRAFNCATVALLNNHGAIIPTDKPLSVKFPSRYTGSFEAGSVWQVKGNSSLRSYRINGRTFTEERIEAKHVVRICPEGKVIAHWIEKNIPGIGQVTAQKLVRIAKPLDQIIRAGDIQSLCSVDGMTVQKAHELISRWPDIHIYSAMRFLADCGLPARLADPIIKIYGARTDEIIKSDPYLLVPLGVPFTDVETLIQQLQLTINQDDRSVAIAEEAAHRKSMTGSTVIRQSDIDAIAQSMGFESVSNAAIEAVRRGALVQVENGYQTIGMARMEAVVGHRITSLAKRKPGEGALFANWELDISKRAVEAKVSQIERDYLEFELTHEQRECVIGAILSPVACISGGAGVGKTTILKAILGVYKTFDTGTMAIHLLALSGRAAQRISQSTNLPAKTIAKHVFDNMESKAVSVDDHALVIIDEASMVDLHTMYRLINVLPDATRLLFVGDTAQLPPVGPGLIFHALVRSGIPTFNLTAVKRQSAHSGIHQFATAVRAGIKINLPKLEIGLKDSPECCHSNILDLNLVKQLWDEAGRSERCIILVPTNVGEFGVDAINAHLQDHIGTERPQLFHLDEKDGILPWSIKGRNIFLGDQVMVTANDYRNNIKNGDLATITDVFPQPTEDGVYGIMDLEGDPIPINDDVIEKLDLGFCITIHKSQGSQWPVAIMLITTEGERMTDRSLLYTGATRPQEQLVIIGPKPLIEKAVSRGNAADSRIVAIDELLPN